MEIVTQIKTSNCCDSPALGEISEGDIGLCSCCKEWAAFEILDED